MTELAQKALDIAISQIGQEEHPRGSNWGHPVQDYLASVGINFPASWCMAFMYWCVRNAIHETSIKSMKWYYDRQSYCPLKKTGGVLDQWNSAPIEIKVDAEKSAEPGDIFIMDFGKGLGHTGIIETIQNGMLHTIEGNTNDTGSREGYEVCRRVRDPKKMKGYLRF